MPRKPGDLKLTTERATIAKLGVPDLQQLRAHAVARIADIDGALKRHGVTPPPSVEITYGEPVVVNAPTMAHLLGCYRDRLTKWKPEGLPVLHAGNRADGGDRYDAVAVLDWYRVHKLHALDAQAERAGRDRSFRELNEMRLARERGRLIPREQAESEGKSYSIAVKRHILALARRLVQKGIIPREREAEVLAECRAALMEMARWTLADVEAFAKLTDTGS